MRALKPSFFTDVDMADLKIHARVLFQGLWCYADREGRLLDNARQIKHDVLPYDRVNIDDLLGALADAGKIQRYEADDGTAIIQVVNFGKHQRPHPKEPASTLPEPNVNGRAAP